jgi:hypothetical protein
MEKMTQYRELVKRLLQERAHLSSSFSQPGIEKLLLTDDEHGQYMMLKLGWDNGARVQWITVYVRVKAGKIWIEQDLTEEGIGNAFLQAGVPREDIVAAFHDPELRQYTELVAA